MTGDRGLVRPELELEHWFPTEVADYLQDFYEDLLAGKRPKVEGSETAG